jgi:hypothetical protein
LFIPTERWHTHRRAHYRRFYPPIRLGLSSVRRGIESRIQAADAAGGSYSLIDFLPKVFL